MASSEGANVAVIMVGGPTKGTRFRPLSFNLAKPLFPLAGQPMVQHPILACKKIPNLAQIYLIGFYEERDFTLYVSAISNELKVPVRYLREEKPHGSAGGLYYFRDLLMEENPVNIFVMNCDVCCSFPLSDMLGKISVPVICSVWIVEDSQWVGKTFFKPRDWISPNSFMNLLLIAAHLKYKGIGTLLVKKVSAESASEFGEIVADAETGELLHYAEKPETFVSEWINCGVYIFTPEIFLAIQGVASERNNHGTLRRVSSFEALHFTTKSTQADFVRLDQDILTPLAGKRKLYTYETQDFWEQIKTPGMSLKCSSLYLAQYRLTAPDLLAKGDKSNSAKFVGDVYVHPSAKIHHTAKVGPNVSISGSARIGPGVRLIGCIILDDVEIKENALISHSIVGWKSIVGRWARVQGVGDYTAKLGITILGEDVQVEDEVVVTNCIVLPHKTLNLSVHDEIIL